ncbi:pentapeptide repeat-containing protein [Lentzea sp. NPDC058450]|uniref:pentapeptide repeat-containing protein n=1 Tax=Lentzea sp. NPDC058450 TaxID=3346505 RepID=UPI00365A44D2
MTTTGSGPGSRWRPRGRPASGDRFPWLGLLVGLAALMAVAGGALWFTFDWLARVASVKADQNAAIQGKDYVTAMLDAVKIALSIVAGGGALIALYLAMRRQRTAERDLRARLDAQVHTEDDAKARRVTELYTKAADQLGSDKAPVRLAGLYALERLGQDNPDQRPTIANLWCAYLRMPYLAAPSVSPRPGSPRPLPRGHRRTVIRHSRPAETSPKPATAQAEAVLERDVRLSVQRLLAKHLRPPEHDHDHSNYWPEIPDLDLTEALLIDLDLSSCVLPVVRMDRAAFSGNTDFRGTTFSGAAWFERATFTGTARFAGATFAEGAVFSGETLTAATFSGATFADTAQFDNTTFIKTAAFSGVTFTFSTFGGARFIGTARFDSATFAKAAQFNRATFTESVYFSSAAFTDSAVFDSATFVSGAAFINTQFTTAVFIDAQFSVARFVGAWFTDAAQFDSAQFTGSVLFDSATFTEVAQFGGARFSGTVSFDRAMFGSDTTFGGAWFASVASCTEATVLSSGAEALSSDWPPGWTCAVAEQTGETLRLVPVPTG